MRVKLVCVENSGYPGSFWLADAETGEVIDQLVGIKIKQVPDSLIEVTAKLSLTPEDIEVRKIEEKK